MSIDMKFGMILDQGGRRDVQRAAEALRYRDAATIDRIYNRVVGH